VLLIDSTETTKTVGHRHKHVCDKTMMSLCYMMTTVRHEVNKTGTVEKL